MKTRRLSVLLPLLGALLLFATTAAANVYKCTGADGRLYFTDRPCPPETKASRVEIDHATRVESSETVPPAAPLPAAPPVVLETPEGVQPAETFEAAEDLPGDEPAESQEETPSEPTSDQ